MMSSEKYLIQSFQLITLMNLGIFTIVILTELVNILMNQEEKLTHYLGHM